MSTPDDARDRPRTTALDRLGLRSDLSRDIALAVVVAALTIALFVVVERLTLTDLPGIGTIGSGARAGVVVLVLAQSGALAVRRRSPLLALALTVAGQVAIVALLPPLVSFRAPATLVAAYTVGAHLPRRTAWQTVAGAAVVEVTLGFALGGPVPAGPGLPSPGAQLWAELASTALAYAGAVLVGGYVGTRRELLARLREQVALAEREREALAARAVLEERGRMARELHDVAAHHLSGIVVQASAAERLVERDPERARESLRWIRTQGRETLDNLRMVVGILRSDDPARDEPAHTRDVPQPTLDDVDDLLDLARRAGQAVRWEADGDLERLSPAVQLTLYRVLQEALTNARRHAPGRPVDARLERDTRALVLTVRNPHALPRAGAAPGRASFERAVDPVGPAGPAGTRISGGTGDPSRPGHGILGMTERAALVGGTLEAGPQVDGAWRVRLTVPVRGGPGSRGLPPGRPPDEAGEGTGTSDDVGQEAP